MVRGIFERIKVEIFYVITMETGIWRGEKDEIRRDSSWVLTIGNEIEDVKRVEAYVRTDVCAWAFCKPGG
jgi:hypothetical protein